MTKTSFTRYAPSLTVGLMFCVGGCGSSSNANGQGAGGAVASGSGGSSPSIGAGGVATPSSGGAGALTAGTGGTTSLAPGSGGTTALGGASGATTGGGASGAMTGGGGSTGGSATTGGSAGVSSGGAANADAGDGSVAAGCSRALLSSTVDAYFKAMAAHDASTLSLAATARFTENATETKLGMGLMWPGAGAVKFKRSMFDTESCNSVTESVVPNAGADTIYGLRIKLANAQITEIESIVVDPKSGWFPTPMGLLNSASDDWQAPLAADQATPRSKMEDIVKAYFQLFATGDVSSFPFASDCKRLENGFSPGACSSGIGGLGAMVPRLIVVDAEAGIAAGFVMFAGALDDFHMFKIGAGQVHGVHAVVGPMVSSPGWPK